ncbi:dockerin type I repeat-containing protein, partial [Phascolarctobacterium faecium]|uniref:dockerin type I repeat-containing protein n=1 Tax=Phascolarctobacterium faecium TaxID=33025 RepID=UPI003AB3B832
EDSVRLFLSSVCKAAYDRQMCPVLWDITGLHYDRNQCCMIDSTLNQQLLSVLDNNVLKGDINQDGKVDTQDVAILGDCLVKKAFLSAEDTEYADINSDGKINAFDYAAIKRIVINSASDKEQLDLSDMPTEYQAALDWVWTNRIEREKSTDRWNTIFDQIDAGNGTLNYVVRWQSYKTVTLDQRKQFEKLIEDSVNNWTDYLVGYDGWKYDHVDVNVIGWAVIDESVILDKQPDEIIYTDCTPYDSSGDTSNGYEEIPTLLPNAPDELSRMEHFYDRSYQYPGGLDKRFDMYLWATQGFPDIGGCGGDWGQRLSDNAYLNMLNGVNVHVFEHELGHGFGITDFYGEEGAIDGFPPGGFPEPTIMMAGNSAEITNYDGWQLRYIWSKIKNQTDSNGTRRFTE